MKKLLVSTAVAGAAALLPITALADSCANVSRAPAACGMKCSSPVVVGHWVWLPSIGVPFPAWGNSPPGTVGSQPGVLSASGLPGYQGNYLNARKSNGGNGYTTAAWLLENSATCTGNGMAQTHRQTSHGIQSGCGA